MFTIFAPFAAALYGMLIWHTRLNFDNLVNIEMKTIILLVQYTVLTSATMMRAAQFEVGGPELLRVGEAPMPELKPKEVLVKVFATAINRADTLQVRLGISHQ